jgi:hypothetical protein
VDARLGAGTVLAMAQRPDPPVSGGSFPARPQMSDTTPPPLHPVVRPRPATVTASAGLWGAGLLAGVVAGVLTATTGLAASRTRLAGLVRQEDPSLAADRVQAVVTTALYASLGVTVLFLGLELALLRVTVRGRGWARAALTLVALAHLGVVVVLQDVVAGGADSVGSAVTMLLALQCLLWLAGLCCLFLPRSNAWFRGQQAR